MDCLVSHVLYTHLACTQHKLPCEVLMRAPRVPAGKKAAINPVR